MKKRQKVLLAGDAIEVIMDLHATNYQFTLVGGTSGTVTLSAQPDEEGDFEPVLASASDTEAIALDFTTPVSVDLNGYAIHAFRLTPAEVAGDNPAVVLYSW
ncbi:TPA: hypothetical protein ACP41M_004776 [Klebsiella aerogenes]